MRILDTSNFNILKTSNFHKTFNLGVKLNIMSDNE
jgi:hypothetical protein